MLKNIVALRIEGIGSFKQMQIHARLKKKKKIHKFERKRRHVYRFKFVRSREIHLIQRKFHQTFVVCYTKFNKRLEGGIHSFSQKGDSRETPGESIFDPRLIRGKPISFSLHSREWKGSDGGHFKFTLASWPANRKIRRIRRDGGGGGGMSISGRMKSVERESAPEINFSFHKK